MKKVLALALAFVLVMGMATIGSAANATISGLKDVSLGESYWTEIKGNNDFDALTDIAPEPGLIRFYIDNSYFDWDTKGGANTIPTTLTTSMLSSGKIDVTAKKTSGYPTLKKVSIKTKSGRVFVEVEFIDELISTKSVDFEYVITLTHKKNKNPGSEVIVAGNMKNPEIEVDADNDTVDLADGSVAKATEYSKGIEVEAGNGIYVTFNMFEDQKYYCKAVMDVAGDDKDIVDKYPQIDTVVDMHTINVPKSATVTMDMDTKYYVYDASGKYIGVSSDKLPMSAKYYLSTTKIDMGEDTTPVEDAGTAPVDVDPANPITGGDDAAPNANDNPGTGANGFVNIAVVAGLVALAAAGAVSMKK